MNTGNDFKIFMRNRKYWVSLLIAFIVGFVVSPYIYPKLFGYSSAQECAIHAKTKWAIGFCFELYPELKK